MFRSLLQKVQQRIPSSIQIVQDILSLQVVLWSLWTLAVGGVAYRDWRMAVQVHQPVNITGLVIDCILVGLIGLVVMTVIEMRIEPWRF
jgi:hypothetical protein